MLTVVTLNTQIENVSFFGNYDPNIWKLITTKLKNLNSIGISYSDTANYFKGEIIQFDNVKNLEPSCESATNLILPTDLLHFKHLKNMKVTCDAHVMELWLNFVLVHPTIEKLVIEFTASFWSFSKLFKNLNEKLNKIHGNTKFFVLRVILRDWAFTRNI